MNRIAVLLSVAIAATSAHARPLDPRSILKTYFETGDIPTESNFSNLIDSPVNFTSEGIELPQWAGAEFQALNPNYDGGPDSMRSMEARIVSITGSIMPNGDVLRVLAVEYVFGNDQGLWIADSDAVFTSVGALEFHDADNELRWELGAAPTLSLNGDPLNGQRAMTQGTFLESRSVACPADVDANGVLNVDDVDAFVVAFLAGVLVVDFDANGVLNVDDVDAFIASFLGGCS